LVSSVALGCGSMLIGVTVDYGIYIVYQLDDSPPASREELARIVARLVPALAFGALTTMAAFFVMFLSPISGHRQLGLFGAVGVGLAALFALFILPLFIPVKAVANNRPLPLTALLQRLFDWRTTEQRLILPLLILFTLICAAGVSRVKFDGDLARLNGVTRGTQQDEKAIRETWGKALSLTTIVVGGATREEVLAKNEQVFAALEKLRGQNVFESFSSVAPLLPSAQTRRRICATGGISGRLSGRWQLQRFARRSRHQAWFSHRSVRAILEKISSPEMATTCGNQFRAEPADRRFLERARRQDLSDNAGESGGHGKIPPASRGGEGRRAGRAAAQQSRIVRRNHASRATRCRCSACWWRH
jgi:hypothetical protein